VLQELMLLTATDSSGSSSAAAGQPSLQQQQQLPAVTASGCSLACVRLLQALPMWAGIAASSSAGVGDGTESSGGRNGSDSSSPAARWAFVCRLLAGVRHITHLLPVGEVYGLVQGAAHAAGACAATAQQQPALHDQPRLLLPLVSAVALRAPELAPSALVECASALAQLGALSAAAPPAAAPPSSSSSSSGGAADEDAAARQQTALLMDHLLHALVVAVQSGGLQAQGSTSSSSGGGSGGVTSLRDVAAGAATPVDVLGLLAQVLTAGEQQQAAAAQGADEQQQQRLTRAQAAGAIAAAVHAAQDALPHLGVRQIAALLAHLACLSRSAPDVLGGAALQDSRCLPLLLELSVRELGSARVAAQLLRARLKAQEQQQQREEGSAGVGSSATTTSTTTSSSSSSRGPAGAADGLVLLQQVASDLVALGLTKEEVQQRLGGLMG
jgi:hypothetical protein